MEVDAEDSVSETYVNPTVVIKVLSRSTEGYDRGFKAENYRLIESLRAYVLVSQSSPHVEIYERQPDESWLLREVRGLQSSVTIPPISVSVALADIYSRVNFTEATGPFI
jgi:Uma2 family endonuclease